MIIRPQESTRSQVQSLLPIKVLIGLFFLLYPFQILGFTIQNYPVTPSVLILILITFRLIGIQVKGGHRFERSLFPVFILFVGYALCIALLRGAYSSLLFLTFFVLLYLPSNFSFLSSQLAQISAVNFIRGGILSLLFVLYDLGRSLLNLPMLSEWLPVFMPQSTYRVGEFWRVSACCAEPSHYAIYMTFTIIALDFTKDRRIWHMPIWALRMLFALALVTTFSLSGVVLLIVYYLLKLRNLPASAIRGIFSPQSRKHSSLRWLTRVAVMSIIAIVSYLGTSAVTEYFDSRVLSITQALVEGDLSSERINYFRVGLEYITQPGARPWLGEATSNIKVWLIQHYAYLESSSMAQGAAANIYLAVLIGLGILGFSIYVFYQIRIFIFITRRDPSGWRGPLLSFYLVWIIAHFATGHMILYPMPGLLLLAKIISDGQANAA